MLEKYTWHGDERHHKRSLESSCLSTGLRPYLGAVSIDSEFRSEKTTDFLPSSSLLHSSDQSRHHERNAKP